MYESQNRDKRRAGHKKPSGVSNASKKLEVVDDVEFASALRPQLTFTRKDRVEGRRYKKSPQRGRISQGASVSAKTH